ncbi:MAG: cupin domain-containing protein [Acidobacteria bacterium]|nr:cupin domain-containing protein [Acidobacteriota bacterium]
MSSTPAWSDEQVRSVAAEYALGVAEAADAAHFETLLLARNELAAAELHAFEESAARLVFAAPVLHPPQSVKDRLMAGIRKEPKPARTHHGFQEELPGYYVLRAGNGKWRPTGEQGVEMQILSHDPSRDVVTALLRMAPGAIFPDHHHSVEEQCWVLEGDVCQLDGTLGIQAGDFFRAIPGTDHGAFTSRNGALLLIVGSAKDERIR